MDTRAQTVVLGALLGALCAGALGSFGLLLTQDLNELADPIGWVILASLIPIPWGAVAGASGVWLLTVRARHVLVFARLIIEATVFGGAIGLAIFGVGSYQGGEAGPAAVMWLMTGGGAVSAFLTARVLKSRYWPSSGPPHRTGSWMM